MSVESTDNQQTREGKNAPPRAQFNTARQEDGANEIERINAEEWRFEMGRYIIQATRNPRLTKIQRSHPLASLE